MRKQLNLFSVILSDWRLRESPYAAWITAAVAVAAAAAIQGNLRKSDRRKKSPSFGAPSSPSLCTLFVCEMRNAVAAFTATDLRLARPAQSRRAQEVDGERRRGRGRSRDGGVTLDSVVRVHACLASSFVHLTRAGCSLPLLLLFCSSVFSSPLSFFLLHSLQVIPTFLVVPLRHS